MIKKKVYLSKQLNLHYRHCEGGVIFEDKVVYTNEEMDLIKKSMLSVEMIHTAKKYFDGVMISQKALEDLNNNNSDGKSSFSQAVTMASELMKTGQKGHNAIHQAASKYNISPQAIGRELGKRNTK